MVNSTQNSLYPVRPSLDQIRHVANDLSLGEQHIDIVNTIGSSMFKNGIPKRTPPIGKANNGLNLLVGKSRSGGVSYRTIGLKSIVDGHTVSLVV